MIRLKYLLARNDGGTWGLDPSGVDDTIVLRSTEQNSNGAWRITDPAERHLSVSERQRYRLIADDIVVTKSSGSEHHIGKASIVTPEISQLEPAFSNFMQRLRVGKNADARYIWFLLNSLSARFHYNIEASSTSGLGNLTGGIFGELRVPVTGCDAQKAIANFLDRESARIDQLIDKRSRFAELLLERRLAVISKAITGSTDDARWLEALPEGWKAERAKLHFSENQKRSGSGEEELLTVSHITGVTKRSEKDVNMFMAESNEGYKLVSPGDLIINTMWAWMGAMGVSSEQGLISPSYGVYTPVSDALRPAFVDLMVRSKPFIAEATRRSKGIHSSRLRLYPDAFLDMPLPIPPVEQQDRLLEEIAQRTQRDDTLMEKNKKAEALLKEYRSALITAAVTGQIDVETWGESGQTDRRLDQIEEDMALREAQA